MSDEDFHDEDFDDQREDGEDMAFDCPRFRTKEGWYCSAQGLEDCDWECPYS